jgi:hypothetical protein
MRWKEITNETATAGASAAGGVAVVAQPLGGVQRRTGVYTNHTVVGPDGRAWNTQGNKKKKKRRVNEAQVEHPLDVLRQEVEGTGQKIDTLAMVGLEGFWDNLRRAGIISREAKEKYMDMDPKELEKEFTQHHGISSLDIVKQKEKEEEKHFEGLPKHTKENIELIADRMDAPPAVIAKELENFVYYTHSPSTVIIKDPDGHFPPIKFQRSEADWLEARLVKKVSKPKSKKTGPMGGYD